MLIKFSIFVLCSVVVLEGLESAGKTKLALVYDTLIAELHQRAGDINEFRKKALERHNYHRRRHGCPELVLNDAISAHAQDWAYKISLGEGLPHRPNNTYGENLYSAWSSWTEYDITGDVAVDSWYSEIDKYVYGEATPHNFNDVGHFTQLIWKNSKQLGIGKIAKNGKVWVVANYGPPGNYEGAYVENVPRLL
ncbi:Golgi-associated plant pathogenesis-related protein 1-like [Photinus pyralis]|uniref:Golgi-associated plant pathogenesis-related protein 1-like n=1 Tax=Photinus pyralis TaxID=7054 RepID=UPI001267007C|nr:Golgi-associated plant pathogenesis-related protein 1-like [Photinus pyralis]